VLRDWLPLVIQSVDPYVSSEDIDKGARWSVDVSSELSVSNYGIICVTADNLDARWLNFEAGALSKSFDKARVSPFLFGIDHSAVTGPLVQFQSTRYQQDDVLRLVRSINAATEHPLETSRLQRGFDLVWPKLRNQLDPLLKLPGSAQSPSRDLDDMLAELLELAREHQKALLGISGTRRPVSDSPARTIDGVNFQEVSFLFGRLRGAISAVAASGQGESPRMIQVRGLAELLGRMLHPLLNAETCESAMRQEMDPDYYAS